METGQYPEYSKAWCDGYNQAQSYRESQSATRVVLDFDETQLDSALAKVERLKKLLRECRELMDELQTPVQREMPFDEFTREITC